MDNSWAAPGVPCVFIGNGDYKKAFLSVGGTAVVKVNFPQTPSTAPQFMHQYTVDEVHPTMPYMSVVEIVSDRPPLRLGFPIRDFRPLQEIEDEIAKTTEIKHKESV